MGPGAMGPRWKPGTRGHDGDVDAFRKALYDATPQLDGALSGSSPLRDDFAKLAPLLRFKY